MTSVEVEFWAKYIDSEVFIQNAKDKEILVWGAYSNGKQICDALEERGYSVTGYIDGHKGINRYCGKRVFTPTEVLPVKKHYVVVAIEGVRREIKSYLNQYEFKKNEDYFYFSESIPHVIISQLAGEYQDVYNNRFVYEGDGSIDIRLDVVGGNNTVIIGSDFRADTDLEMRLSYGGTIMLGSGCVSRGIVALDVSMGGKILAGKGLSLMTNTNINARYGAKICLGDYVTFGERLFLSSGSKSTVSIGNDCMFSHDVSVIGTNGHSIIDLGERRNRSNNETPINIGNHVWVGKGATILYGTDVLDGCVVGTRSIAKGHYPSRCIIAGNIAKVIRENCTWDRRIGIEYEEL